MGATCLAPGLIHVFLVFAASQPVQSGSHSFSLGGATCFASGLMLVLLVFATPRPLQSGSRSFSLLGATCLAQGRLRFFFWEEVAKCDLPCAKWAALFLWVARLPTLLKPMG